MAGMVLFALALLSGFISGLGRQTRDRGHLPGHLPGRLILEPVFVQLCPNTSDAVRIKYFNFEKYGVNVFVDGELEFTRKVEKITKTLFIINNCEDRNLVNCQHFQTMRFGDESCTFMTKQDVFWSTIFRRVHPELRCPILPGVYKARNATMDVNLLRLLPFPLEKYFWRAQFESYDHDRFLCAELGGRFLRSRH